MSAAAIHWTTCLEGFVSVKRKVSYRLVRVLFQNVAAAAFAVKVKSERKAKCIV